MINLTNLIREYRQEKDRLILDKIYLELKSTIKQKAKYIYFSKWYPLNLYHKCKFCRNCNELNNIPKKEHYIICKDCKKCRCVKGYFNLNKNNLCDYEDIENDIWLEILRVVDNFDIDKDFNTYLFSCLWEFMPSFITKDFVKSLTNKSLTQKDEEGNETQIDIPDESEEVKLSLEDIFKECKTKKEKKLITLFLKDKKMTQEEAGKIMKLSQQSISLIFNRLQKKLKKYL